ncbi:MAG: UvrD-helicase domain-containing protein [Paludibacter sp.]|nr:UvrD-helicase domain-containing protein [Paludibacter sp.]
MNIEIIDNNIDNNVDEQIYECLNLETPKSFFLFAGAGSGKTKSLVNVLERFKIEYGKRFRLERKKIAIITYTNAAANEITHRLKHNSIFQVSTIHSFAWEIIKNFTNDIRNWLKENLSSEIIELEDQQTRSKNLQNKTSIDRARKIESKTKRIKHLEEFEKFTYNPNGDNILWNSLNHTEVISIAAHFINEKKLMQDLLVCKFPIILIDESQDTKKELVDAFFKLQENKNGLFTLGLFGDTMQRIYTDGKESLGQHLPNDMVKPAKRMNHRSNKRIITLINNIRKNVDGQEQIPRTEKRDGFVRLFICKRGLDKSETEKHISNQMSEITKDIKWNSESDDFEIKTLILEHHMAARRMGFLEFFEPLYKEDKLSTGLLDGSLAGANFFTNIILPIINADEINDNFEIARIVKKYSRFLKKDEIFKSVEQLDNIRKSKEALTSLLALWKEDKDPTLINILNNVYLSGLFPIPESLISIASRTDEDKKHLLEPYEEEDENLDVLINAWDLALSNPFSQIKYYHDYLSESSKFGTHQGVKGLEYQRVMVILDDEESRGFLFSYDKLFGSKDLSATDIKNIDEGKETGIERTRRLFYVACSRAMESLAIVAYTDNLEIVRENALKFGWFTNEEIKMIYE